MSRLAPVERDALVALGDLLDEIGYAALYDLSAGGALFPGDRSAARRLADALPGEARAVLRLCALDTPVPAGELPVDVGAVARRLLDAGLARQEPEGLRLDDLVVVPVLSGRLLTATPPGWRPPGARSGRGYIGEDSLRLARALPDAAGRAVLDVGTGCGIQGLLAARGAARRVLTDVEERSLALSRLNAVLNRCEDAEVRAGAGYAPVAGERFDLIVCLPPYLPALGAGDATVATGADGLGLLRALLEGAADHLVPGGALVCFAQLLCDDDGPLLARELPALVRGGVTISCAAADWSPLHPYARELGARLVAAGRLPAGLDAHRLVLEALRGLGATGVATATIRAVAPRPGAGARGARTWVGGGAPRHAGEVYAPAVGLRFGHDQSLRTAVTAEGTSHVLPGPTAALLAAFDGRCSLDEAATKAWGAHPDADARDLLDEALARAAELERAGLLTRAG